LLIRDDTSFGSNVADDSNVSSNIDRLANVLAARCNDYWRIENARAIAESYFDLVRIRSAEMKFCGGSGVSKVVVQPVT
jgi:hypothetical protein